MDECLLHFHLLELGGQSGYDQMVPVDRAGVGE